MAKKIRLEIEDPCHENWDNMNPVEKGSSDRVIRAGRYCDSCQKQVIDFSNMSDREIAQFFKKPSTGSICGRFMTDQLNRDLDIPKKHIPWVKYFFTIAIPAFFASKGYTQGATRIKKNTGIIQELVTNKAQKLTSLSPVCTSDTAVLAKLIQPADETNMEQPLVAGGVSVISSKPALHGQVINENGEPVPYASIMLKERKYGAMADDQGYFSISTPRNWKQAELLVSSAGYVESSTIVKRNNQPANLVITLTVKTALPAVVVSAWGMIKRTDIMGGVSVVRTKTTTTVIAKPVIKKIQANIYPNPVLAGGTINIASKELKEGYYSFQLLSMKGQVVHQREVWVDDKATVLNFEVPRIAAGNYVLRMIHKSSGESFTEKVLVQ